MKVKIDIKNNDVQIPQELIEAAGGDAFIARIFFNRGYKNPDTVRQMLNEDLYTPTLVHEFPGMDRAVDRIVQAIKHHQKICVYGDYDVDGVTSTAILMQCLQLFTGRIVYHVPDRFTEGYGMNSSVIQSLFHQGVSLIITCDCGISNTAEIALAKELGMDVVITDHHNVPDGPPKADVILNPKLLEEGHKARNLSGCGMAYFLCLALLKPFQMEEKAEEFLDLLALSLVADVVSLNGENRYLLKKAMPKLFNTKRTGLLELFRLIEKNSKLSNEEDIAFQIAPRINAAGRMESARLPVELFLTHDVKLAQEMANKIDLLNQDRKRLQQEMIKQAEEIVESKKKNKTLLVVFKEFWHHGIIGITAGKICETYRKPAILLSLKEDGKTVVGSARSTEEINIYELIKASSSKLIKFGGHAQAAGLSLRKEDLESFTHEIERYAESKHYIKDEVTVSVDMELAVDQVDEDIYQRLVLAGPYGEGFEPPLFYAKNVSVLSDRKTDKNHHITVLEGDNDIRIPAVKWFGEDYNLQGKVFDITYKIGRNTYKGNNSLQLTLSDIVESDGKLKTAYKGNIHDYRGKPLLHALDEFKSIEFFYEGLNDACPVTKTFDRYSIKKTKNIMFVSTPVNTAVFREVVLLSNPDNIIIGFSSIPDYSFKGFMTNLLGLIKHIVNKEMGTARLEEITSKLCIEETILVAAFKYLRAAGKVEYSMNSANHTVYFTKGSGNVDRYLSTYEKSLKDALMEKHAYSQFLRCLETDKFKEFLK